MMIRLKRMFAMCAAAVLFSGCSWGLPEGEVPESLIGENHKLTENTAMELNDAEAAMCGAVVRVLIRKGHVSERTPIAFTLTSTAPQESFVSLLTGTDLIWVCGVDSAKYLLDSKVSEGEWHLRMLKKDGTVLLEKRLKYRPIGQKSE